MILKLFATFNNFLGPCLFIFTKKFNLKHPINPYSDTDNDGFQYFITVNEFIQSLRFARQQRLIGFWIKKF